MVQLILVIYPAWTIWTSLSLKYSLLVLWTQMCTDIEDMPQWPIRMKHVEMISWRMFGHRLDQTRCALKTSNNMTLPINILDEVTHNNPTWCIAPGTNLSPSPCTIKNKTDVKFENLLKFQWNLSFWWVYQSLQCKDCASEQYAQQFEALNF